MEPPETYAGADGTTEEEGGETLGPGKALDGADF